MSFLKANPLSGIGMAANPNGAAKMLGGILHASPTGVMGIADRIGHAANGVAQAGGADPGYDGGADAPNNFLQNLDPNVLRALQAKFGPAQNAGYVR